MAEAAVEFILTNVQQYIANKVNLLRGGDEVVRWIEYEFETLIPQLETADSLSRQAPSCRSTFTDLNEKLTNLIRKAELLAQTYTKSVIQINAARGPDPVKAIKIGFITRRLHRIRDDISKARDELSELVNEARGKASQQMHSPEQDGEATSPEQSITSYLSRCIYYFLLFPPEPVPARRMVALWVAEGLVRSKKDDIQSVEQIASGYLEELSRLGKIQIVKNRSGKVKTCSIDALRRNELLEEARKANFLQDRDKKIRRLVDHNGNDGASFILADDPKIFLSLRNYRDVVSFFSFNTQEGSKPGESIGDFLRKCISSGCFIWLNALDLERVFRPKLPDALGEIISLKYLGLRWTYLEQLPGTVNRLLNLQVLDVKHTYISVLPRSIWTMEFLRHLYLSESYRTKFPDPPSKVTLTTLQTLWGGFVDEETCVENGLDRALNIRKLGLSCRIRGSRRDEMSKKLEAVDRWISNLKHLESLRLKSRDDEGNASDLLLTSLEGNRNLSTVYLLGKLDASILYQLPVSLTDLTLSGSELGLDPMRFLGRLPNLMILRLLGRSVLGSKLFCSRRGFQKLKLLWIWKLENLQEFEAEEGSLPSLEEVEIRSCDKLGNLPNRLREIENLEVKLTSPKPEFLRRAGARYAQIEHIPKDDLYILRNKPTTMFILETEDLVSPCFSTGYQHSISRISTPASIF